MYGKLFTQMYDGTLATRGPWQALVTFQQLVILADKTGIVDMTAESIARRTTVPLDIILIGITALEVADPESRSPDEDGRRIVRLSDDRIWGWRIVNYEHYRKLRSQDERREYMRTYQQKRRASVNSNVNNVSNVNQSSKQYAVSKVLNVELKGGSGGGEGAQGVETKGPPKKINGHAAKGSRLTETWRIPEDWIDWTSAAFPKLDRPTIIRKSIIFRDFWIAKAGPNAVKLNWLATWRNWMRKDQAYA